MYENPLDIFCCYVEYERCSEPITWLIHDFIYRLRMTRYKNIDNLWLLLMAVIVSTVWVSK